MQEEVVISLVVQECGFLAGREILRDICDHAEAVQIWDDASQRNQPTIPRIVCDRRCHQPAAEKMRDGRHGTGYSPKAYNAVAVRRYKVFPTSAGEAQILSPKSAWCKTLGVDPPAASTVTRPLREAR